MTPLNLSSNGLDFRSGAELAQAYKGLRSEKTPEPSLKSSQTEETNASSMSNISISMMVLGGFIAAAGIAAVAIAFTLLNAATLGIPGLVLAVAGVAASLAGAGLFATGYKDRQTTPEDSLDLSTIVVNPL